MEGIVSPDMQPRLNLSLMSPDGTEFEVTAIVDTGFSGYVTLPTETIRQMGLTFDKDGLFTIGNNNDVQFDLYKGAKVYWHSQDIEIIVMAVQGDAFLGMELLNGSRLTVEAKPGGHVKIVPLKQRTPRQNKNPLT